MANANGTLAAARRRRGRRTAPFAWVLLLCWRIVRGHSLLTDCALTTVMQDLRDRTYYLSNGVIRVGGRRVATNAANFQKGDTVGCVLDADQAGPWGDCISCGLRPISTCWGPCRRMRSGCHTRVACAGHPARVLYTG